MTQVTLIIARHGNTFNPGETPRRIGARTDLPLTESGIMQASALGKHLRAQGIVPEAVFSSQQCRTQQTATLAVEEIGTDIPVEPLAIFNELDYGPDENMPEDAVLARIGAQALKDWDEHAVPPAGWQIDPEALIRSWLDFGASLVQNHGGHTILVVTSNGTARFAPHLTCDFEGFRKRFPLKLATGAYGIMTHDGTGWRAQCWNIRP